MATKTNITWERFLASAKEGQKCGWIDGEVVQMPPVDLRHEWILARMFEYLSNYCRSRAGWIWFPSNGALTMKSGNWRLPCAALSIPCFPDFHLELRKLFSI
jgi:Uma2 family endonuclease